MLTKYEIEEEELKPKIKHLEPKFPPEITIPPHVEWRPVTATQIPNPVWVDYSGIHETQPPNFIAEYNSPTSEWIIEEQYLPF